ncbi:MAG TPA: MarR family transcriptional regulator, partial [Beijerinckiaceae bacterium]
MSARAAHETPDYADLAGSDLEVLRMPGHHIRRLQQVAVRLFAETVGAELTPVQYAALVAIAQRPGVGQAALAALIGYDRATIGGVIDRLEQKGWVQRKPSADDRRQNLLTVTAQGRETLARAAPAVQAVQDKIVEPLDEAERAL